MNQLKIIDQLNKSGKHYLVMLYTHLALMGESPDVTAESLARELGYCLRTIFYQRKELIILGLMARDWTILDVPSCMQLTAPATELHAMGLHAMSNSSKETASNGIRYTLDTVSNEILYTGGTASIGKVIMEKTKQLVLVRTADDEPGLPAKVSEVYKSENNLPFKSGSVFSSFIWYWALQRYKLHGIDAVFNDSSFKRMIVKCPATVGKIFGQDWEKLKGYVDWYLASKDPFIAKTCAYNFEFFCSNTCINKKLVLDSKVARNQGIIMTDEQRENADGVWIK